MLKDRFKNLIDTGKEGGNKKKIENLVVFVVLLIITIVIINSIWKNQESSSKEIDNTANKNLALTSETNIPKDNEYNISNIEEKLENILNSIKGVGKVKVFINYSSSSTVEAMYNETTKESSTKETDTSGGVRTIDQTDTQKDVIFSENSGAKTPVTKKVTNPTIEGAVITAEGAGDSNIKANIVDAVSAVTGLAAHKIQVFKMNDLN